MAHDLTRTGRTELIQEVLHLREQRDQLQTCNTELVVERRELKAERDKAQGEAKKLREQFLSFCEEVITSEHMGDVFRTVNRALKSAGYDTGGLFNDYEEVVAGWFERPARMRWEEASNG